MMAQHPLNNNRIIVALDYTDTRKAWELVSALDPMQCRLKVGKELFTRSGPVFVEKLTSAGFDVFLDLKFHDIPNTVSKACQAAADLGVWMINVHALGGRRMMEAACETLQGINNPPKLIAVTILTSMNDQDLHEIGIQSSAHDQAIQLASLARQCGVDGVVCSAREIVGMRGAFGPDFTLVTPGIRPADAQKDDQKRTTTPSEAIHFGADYLVIGRPITASGDPKGALITIQSEIDQALAA